MKNIFSLLLLLLVFGYAGSQVLLTTAEKSNYASTSTYREVLSFIEELRSTSPYIRMDTLTVSEEERMIPLMILSNPLPAATGDISADKRIKVYLQANIHAGEVEGKEACLMLARDLLKKPDSEIMKNCIILICPILNADGNEKFNLQNRTNQNGPVNGVGVRYNGQFLDLNRDAIKLESPEIRAVVTRILNQWDPAITVDCHTTNGSYHEEPITFTWMMNPNGDRKLINFMRDNMMPAVHKHLFDEYKVKNIFYGEFIDRLNIDSCWICYASEPRYLVNYIGVRNRLAILNENYVYADFKTRVEGCYYLLKSILEYATHNKIEILNLLNETDQAMILKNSNPAVPDSFAIEYKGQPTPEKITINAYEADTIPGVKGYWRYKQSDRKRTVTVPYIADYYPVKSIPMPYAYLINIPDKELISVIKAHGIVIEKLNKPVNIQVGRFKINSIKGSERLNQGHYTNSVEGEFVMEQKDFPAGTYFIRTGQKLGRLAAYLLEPQSDDALLLWNFFDRYLVPQWGGEYFPYPVYRVIDYESVLKF